jgi:hypothetical protein
MSDDEQDYGHEMDVEPIEEYQEEGSDRDDQIEGGLQILTLEKVFRTNPGSYSY